MDWLYNDTVKEHFLNPHNVLNISEAEFMADGVGLVGNPQCGDMMQVLLKVDKNTEKITDFKWKTYGCASAVGSTSMLSDIVLENGGMTLTDAWQILPSDITKRLGGLPDHKIHCSVLGDKALRSAIADYYRKHNLADKIPVVDSKIICNCMQVSEQEILDAIEDGVRNFLELQERTKIATACGQCRDIAEAFFSKHQSQKTSCHNDF